MRAVDGPALRSRLRHPRGRGEHRGRRRPGAALWHQRPPALRRPAGPRGRGRHRLGARRLQLVDDGARPRGLRLDPDRRRGR